MDIIYLRVSTNEDRQDLDQQLDAILDKFNLDRNKCKIMRDEASAYNIDKIHKRKDFLALLELVFHAKDISVMDIFLGNYKAQSEPIDIYVWDYSRIMRNIIKNLFFFLFAMEHNIRIHTYKDAGLLDEEMANTLNGKALAIINNVFIGMQAQAYSETLSKDISRAYDSDTHSSKYGRAWSKGFTPNINWIDHWSETITNNKGKVFPRLTETGRLRMTSDELKDFKKHVTKLLKQGYMRVDIIKMVEQNKGIYINQSYITRNFQDII